MYDETTYLEELTFYVNNTYIGCRPYADEYDDKAGDVYFRSLDIDLTGVHWKCTMN
jgi:hypothetical protein